MKKYWVIFFLFLLPSFVNAQNDTAVAGVLHRLTELSKQGQTDKALTLIDSLNEVSAYQYDPRFYVLKAVLYLTVYENKAPDQKDNFLLTKASDALFKARVLNNSSSLDTSIKELLIRVASHYLYQGTYDFNKKRYQQALKEFMKAEYINRQPFVNLEDTILYFTIGQTALLLKDTVLAKKYLKLSFEHDYASPGMVMDLYDMYAATGDKDSAVIFLKKGLLMFPGNANILNELANYYLSVKDYAAAKPLLEQLAKQKQDFGILYNLAAICQQTKNYECANNYYYKALKIKKDAPDVLFNLSLSLYTLSIDAIRKEPSSLKSKKIKRQLTTARKLLKKYLRQNPHDKDALQILQSIYKLTGKKRKATCVRRQIQKIGA